MSFPTISPKQSFPALESEVLAYWKANDTFQKSIDSRPADNPYRFYDGPPFITGTPHYGSLLSSIVKDVVGRYWTMRGRRVERVWGWDCHGLPIEERVQKKLGLKSNADIEAAGVKNFIDECYKYTGEVSSEWDWYINRIGRWVDMEHAYRTMDQDYMESVMWVFSELWKKGLIYEGKRVSLYSWKLGTPISNFEVAMDDTYQEVNDPAITVKFRPDLRKACGIVVENEKGEILLGHNKKGYWGLPAGKAEEGETHEDCATRELLEETGIGYHISAKDHIDYDQYDVIGGKIYDNQTYKISVKNIDITNGEPEKFIEWKFFPIDQLPENTFEPLLYTLERIRENKTLKNLPLSILAWTTTPWTIPANMALAVRNDIDYVLVENSGEQFILAKNRAESVFKGKGEYTIIRELKGSELVGLGYVPPFPEYYYDKFRGNSPLIKGDVTEGQGDLVSGKIPPTPFIKGEPNKNHKIYHADFITDTDGTGIGHEAPEFGDVDFQLAKKEGIYISEAMDEAGKYTSQIYDYEGTHYLDLENPEKGANKVNIERMKANNTLFKLEGITHRVPFCPRSGTPLVQKAQASWFIDIQSQKEKLLEANASINWFPAYLKEGRFAKGIESAPDWCISRTRYWGAPMPVWMGEDGEQVVVSSREEIYEMNKPYGQLTKVIFVRHGETDYNLSGKIDPLGKGILTEKGKSYAESLANQLRGTKVDKIYCSSLPRSVVTTKYISESLGIDPIVSDEIKEWQVLSLQDKSWESVGGKENYSKWENIVNPGDESIVDLYDRTSAFLKKVIQENPGKTVIISSHHFAILCMQKFLHNFDWDTEAKKYVIDNASQSSQYQVEYTFSDGATAFNLHKPYIDSIFLAPKNAQKAKKVLGVHGWKSLALKRGYEGTWLPLQDKLKEAGIQFDVPDFDKNEETSYAKWKETLDTIDIADYDTILATSFGCPVIMQYLCEKNIKVPRLILVAPSGLIGNEYLEKVIPEMTEDISKIKDLVGEILITHSKDDDSTSAPFSYGLSLSEKIGGAFLPVDGFKHSFSNWSVPLLSGLIQYGAPLTRIPEVLDVWMDSGSMPYAQMHYPFANKEAMEASFPADFIAEYVGQVRAWFYVMHVLGVLLNIPKPPHPNPLLEERESATDSPSLKEKGPGDEVRPAFLNVITTGVVNGNDGRKMSKSFGNYPDPRMAIEKYGADPIRFYMLNSPLLSGGDMDFKEEGVVETIKSVMLPLWNTYSFFTTYANIDGWEKSETEVYFVRHGETDHNTAQIMNGGDIDTPLSVNGKKQAEEAGKSAGLKGIKFDVIYSSPLSRALDTAEIIAKEIGYTGEIIKSEGLLEQLSGKYAGKTIQEIGEEIGNPSVDAIRKAYKEENGIENIDQFESRVLPAFQKILSENAGKKILIVAHTGTFRPINRYITQSSKEEAHYSPSIPHAELIKIGTIPLVNPLDRWILSKLQVLMGQVHDAMDGYDVSRACRAIVEYMDELTNWYVRLSRRRFWESGMTPDKESAYETLYTVLTEVSKLLAPFMPFLSESIWRGLHLTLIPSPTGEGGRTDSPSLKEKGLGDEVSVHLEYVTLPSRHLIANDLNRDMEICEHIVSLGLALRSQKNIRVRQPLQSVTVTKELSEYYQAIIRDELNVKEVRFENPEKLAKKICKPDARKIGPKYGKDVQKVIMEAKNGNFIEKEDGIIDVGGFILEPGEYSLEYIPLEGVGDVTGGYGMVVALDTEITEPLKLEGYARDIIRLIQDMRKEADYGVSDRISLSITGQGSEDILGQYGEMITSETLSTFAEITIPDIEKLEEIDEGMSLTLRIAK